MRFGIHTLDELQVQGKTVLCRVDINQPVDRSTGKLRRAGNQLQSLIRTG